MPLSRRGLSANLKFGLKSSFLGSSFLKRAALCALLGLCASENVQADNSVFGNYYLFDSSTSTYTPTGLQVWPNIPARSETADYNNFLTIPISSQESRVDTTIVVGFAQKKQTTGAGTANPWFGQGKYIIRGTDSGLFAQDLVIGNDLSTTGVIRVEDHGFIYPNTFNTTTEAATSHTGWEPYLEGTINLDGTENSTNIRDITQGGVRGGSGYNAYIGREGNGTLHIEGGSTVQLNNSAFLGYESNGVGRLTVTGQDSSFTTGRYLQALGALGDPVFSIGDRGHGTLSVTDGGHVVTLSDATLGVSSFVVPSGSSASLPPGGQGVATISGTNSSWTILRDLTLGQYEDSGSGYTTSDGSGRLTVSHGATVHVGSTGVNSTSGSLKIGARGELSLQTGTVWLKKAGEGVLSDGTIRGDGTIRTDSFASRAMGTIEVLAGQELTVVTTGSGSGKGSSAGRMNIHGGSFVYDRDGTTLVDRFENLAAGSIQVLDGKLTLTSGLDNVGRLSFGGSVNGLNSFSTQGGVDNKGTMNFAGGSTHFETKEGVISSGNISFTAGSNQFIGNLTNSGTVLISGGSNKIMGAFSNSAIVSADLTISGGVNSISDGVTNGNGSDVIITAGNNTLGSTTNGGDLYFTGGGNTIQGDLTNQATGKLVIQDVNDLSLVVNGDLTNSGTMQVGDISVVVSGDWLSSGSSSVLLGGLSSGDLGEETEFTRFIVGEEASLSGTLIVNTTSSFTLALGSSFEILTALDGTTLDAMNTYLEKPTGLDSTLELELTEVAGTGTNSSFVLNVLTAAIGGDLDRDGDVDVDDLALWQTNYGNTGLVLSTDGDIDRDGDVDGQDLLILRSQFGGAPVAVPGAGSGSFVSTAVVPEPSSLVLLGIGFLTLLGFKRRR